MANKWIDVSLSDISERIGDGLHGTPTYSENGEYFFVNGNNLENGEITIKDSTKKVDLEQYLKHKKDLNDNAILVSINGTIGNVALYNGEEVVLGKSACYINLKKNIHRDFVAYVLSSHQFQEYIQRCATGSTIKNVSLKMMREFSFRMPEDETEQIKAVETLKNLDSKISLSRKSNQTLEQMSQALFKSWFVDFDPVIDNALAAGTNVIDFPEALQHKAEQRAIYKEKVQQLAASPETKSKLLPDGLPQEISALFPSEFEQSGEPSRGINGWIPKGWSVGNMNQHAIIQMGQSPKGDTYNSDGVGTPLVNGPVEFGPYFTKKSKWTSAPTKLSKQSDLIVCVRGSTTGRFVKSDGIYCLGRGVCSVRGVRSQVFTDQIFKNSIKTLLGLATGSTFPNWSRQILNEFKVIQPQNNVIDAFNSLITPKVQKIELNVIESESLSRLRDTLLPKLISGEITINKDVA